MLSTLTTRTAGTARHTRRAKLIAASCVVMLTAACGSDEGASPSDAPETETAETDPVETDPAETVEPDEEVEEVAEEIEAASITLQASWISDAEFMGFFVAEDNGYYDEAAIDFEFLPGGPDVLPESQLLSGQADIAISSPDTTARAILEQGAPFKIIAADFQKSPLGILSLADGANIETAADMVGKTIAAGTAAITPIEAMLRSNDIDPATVTFVPYSFDPSVLLDGEIDGAADFCPDTPYVIEQEGGDPTCTLLYDLGYEMYNQTLVVTEETLATQRDELVRFLRASQAGWTENFVDPDLYPAEFESTWFEGTGRAVAHETSFNNISGPLMEHPDGYMTISDEDVAKVIETMNGVGIDATADMFDTTLMAEVNAG